MPQDTPAPFEVKTCRGACGECKPVSEFYPNYGPGATGYWSRCKACVSAERTARNAARRPPALPPAPDGQKRCTKCAECKPLSEFGRKGNGLKARCKACIADIQRESLKDPDRRAKHRTACKRWLAQNPDSAAQIQRRSREKNRDVNLERCREWGRAETGREWRRAYLKNNRDRINAQARARRVANPEMVRENTRRGNARRQARKMNLPVAPYTRAELRERDGDDCVLCGEALNFAVRTPHPMSVTVDHLECLSWPDSAGDVPSNVALAHRTCNLQRHNRPHPAAAAKRAVLLAAEALTT